MDHVRIEVAGTARGDLKSRYTFCAYALGVVFRFKVALNNRDPEPAGQ